MLCYTPCNLWEADRTSSAVWELLKGTGALGYKGLMDAKHLAVTLHRYAMVKGGVHLSVRSSFPRGDVRDSSLTSLPSSAE